MRYKICNVHHLLACTRDQSITQGSTMEISAHNRCIICFVVLIELGTLNNLWFWYRFWKTGMNFVLFWHFRKNMLWKTNPFLKHYKIFNVVGEIKANFSTKIFLRIVRYQITFENFQSYTFKELSKLIAITCIS